MHFKRLVSIILVLATLGCGSVPKMIGLVAPSPTPTATFTPEPTATATSTPTETPLPPPAFVPQACTGIAAATIPPATTIAQPTSSLATNPELATEEQLAVFDQLTDDIKQHYLYPDFNGQDWTAVAAEVRAKVEAGMDTEAFYKEMDDYIIRLGDDHSDFESPVEVAEAEAELTGTNNYVGIGILTLPLIEKKRTTVLAVLPGSSAEQAGLQPHDSILAVDGIPIIDDGTVYVSRVRGPECSVLVLTVQSPGEAPRQVSLYRYHITASIPIYTHLVDTTDGSRIGYMMLPTFFDGTIPGQVRAALDAFGSLDGLILDNRVNGGGSSLVLEPILSYFTSGTVGHFISRSRTRPLNITADPVGDSQTVPLVVLVGKDTVSFGEIFAGILQDIGRAKVVGQTTDGNVETLNGFNLQDGSRVWLAAERFDPPVSHADWEQQGIIPDVQAYADWDTITFENDPSVAAAVKLLGH